MVSVPEKSIFRLLPAKNYISETNSNVNFYILGEQVMLDRDLAAMYQVQVKRLNEQVKRNSERLPKAFAFS